jgi:hypothetical protein
VARRSPQNERYRKDAKIGATRKSASSAKPKRKVADPVSSSGGSSSKSSGTKAKPAKGRFLLPNPDTPEFRRWNILNYVALGVAMLAAFAVLIWSRQVQGTWVNWVLWAIWGIGLASSMYIQIKIVRPLRQEWERTGMAEAKARALAEEKAASDAAYQQTKADMADAKAAKKADAAKGTGSAKASSGPKPDDAAKVTFTDQDD